MRKGFFILEMAVGCTIFMALAWLMATWCHVQCVHTAALRQTAHRVCAASKIQKSEEATDALGFK